MNKEQNKDKEILKNKTSPISILDEINKLYQQLFEIDLAKSKNKPDECPDGENVFSASKAGEVDISIRRDEIMALIMQLTHEYIQITSHKN